LLDYYVNITYFVYLMKGKAFSLDFFVRIKPVATLSK
jgi:hypothetical protein